MDRAVGLGSMPWPIPKPNPKALIPLPEKQRSELYSASDPVAINT